MPVSGGGSWKAVATAPSLSTTCGIKSDDSLWCWGLGTSGQLGNGGSASSSVPVPVIGSEKWASVGGLCGLIATKAYCWSNRDVGVAGLLLTSNPSATWCGSPAGRPGKIIYNDDANTMQFCDGVGWVKVGR